jgi:hypothetical protein
MRKQLLLQTAILGLLFSVGAMAHHARIGIYQMEVSKRITIKGTVIDYKLKNPHGRILVDVTSAAGKKEKWVVDTPNYSNMVNFGWKADSLKVGDEVTIVGYPALNPKATGMYGYLLTFKDGKKLPFSDSDY